MIEGLFGKYIVKVACSYYHTVAVTEEDEVFSFGRNDYGQLGQGDTSDKHSPFRIDTLRGRPVQAIACGQYHTVISFVGGGMVAMGKNDYGQLGTEDPSPRKRPVQVVAPLAEAVITNIGCGYYHTVVLTREGQVYCFGRNDYGQLGLGHKENSWQPKQVTHLESRRIVQVTCGCYHTLTLTDDGLLFPFGRNNHGQLGCHDTSDSLVPIQVDTLALAGVKVAQVAAGFYHTVVLTGPPLKQQQRAVNRSLSADLRRILNNPLRSDVTFLVEGQPIYAHRCIIMARCEPLERMLNGPMMESTQREIVIHDQQYLVFLGLLEYLYTDNVDSLNPKGSHVDIDYALDLLAVADQFLVGSLKRKCEMAIKRSINVENVSFMLQTADERQANALRRKCFDFVLHHFGQVIATPAFSQLPQLLLQEVLHAASRRGVQIGQQPPPAGPSGKVGKAASKAEAKAASV
jgi:RCC1 and BTB domain-containing protein